MGNVTASTVPPSPPLSPQPSLAPPSLDKENSISSHNESSRLESPGTMEELHKKCKDIFPMNFEGGKLMLNKGLSSHFQISHTIVMSSMMPSGYRFGATYVGTKQISPSETFPVLLGDVDPSGNLNANIIHQFTDRIRGKVAAQFQKNKLAALQMTTDYRGDTYSFSATSANLDILNNSGLLVLHYLKSVTSNLALGGELAYQKGPTVPGGYITILSAAGRYSNGDSTISGNIGFAGAHLCFYQRASQQLQFGVEFELIHRMQECKSTVAYQVDLPKADLTFKGSIDTNWLVGATLEKRLQPLPFTFVLSGMINHCKNQFRLGCGLIIG
ncbi:mitochondrial import receptor subunit TOM40 homolog 1 [Copidosoma floridanum]|uniref:mitochondrial import receptor subunit TOM40 homolog 1 n=1 Tax=Copidosoma floridanum TaxID=29053 RepID=UPI0006C9E2C1|nr:mitochondrial import receptor subunit TOM40 homolog 1 [Copidosoma floridanum]